MPVLKTVFLFLLYRYQEFHTLTGTSIYISSPLSINLHISQPKRKEKQKFPEGGSMSDIVVASALYPLYML